MGQMRPSGDLSEQIDTWWGGESCATCQGEGCAVRRQASVAERELYGEYRAEQGEQEVERDWLCRDSGETPASSQTPRAEVAVRRGGRMVLEAMPIVRQTIFKPVRNNGRLVLKEARVGSRARVPAGWGTRATLVHGQSRSRGEATGGRRWSVEIAAPPELPFVPCHAEAKVAAPLHSAAVADEHDKENREGCDAGVGRFKMEGCSLRQRRRSREEGCKSRLTRSLSLPSKSFRALQSAAGAGKSTIKPVLASEMASILDAATKKLAEFRMQKQKEGQSGRAPLGQVSCMGSASRDAGRTGGGGRGRQPSREGVLLLST